MPLTIGVSDRRRQQRLVVVRKVLDVERDLAGLFVLRQRDGRSKVVRLVERDVVVRKDRLFAEGAVRLLAEQLHDDRLRFAAGLLAGDAERPAGVFRVAVPFGGDGANGRGLRDGVRRNERFDGEVRLRKPLVVRHRVAGMRAEFHFRRLAVAVGDLPGDELDGARLLHVHLGGLLVQELPTR